MATFSSAAATFCFCPITAAGNALEGALRVLTCAHQQDLRVSDYLSMSTACWQPGDVCFEEDICPSNEAPEYQETPEDEAMWAWCSCCQSTRRVVAQSTGILLSCEFPTSWNIVAGRVDKDQMGWCVWLESEDGYVNPVELQISWFDECTGAELTDNSSCKSHDQICWGFSAGHHSWNPDLCQFDHFESYWKVYEGQLSPQAPYDECS